MAAPPRSFSPGAFYADRRVVSLLGQGGMGTVYRVEHPRLSPRERALKVLHPGIWVPPRWEVNAASRLGQHPNLVRTLGAGHDAATGTYYHEMELLHGSTFEELVQERGPLTPEVALRWLAGVAAGLDAAHAQGLVHCDLKPSNVLLTLPEEVPKLLDFGIAEAVSERAPLQARGTLWYMACEQLNNGAVVPQTDLWAFGLVGHYLLTGTRYWQSVQASELRREIVAGPLPLPSAAWGSHLPDALRSRYDAWLLTCLERVPERRFASCALAVMELRRAFEESRVELGEPLLPARLRSSTGDARPLRTTALVFPHTLEDALTSDEQVPAATATPELPGTPDEVHRGIRALLLELLPRVTELVRVADDLATSSAHYLLRVPGDRATLQRQIEWFSLGVEAYNRSRAEFEGERAAFAAVLSSVFGVADDALHAAAREAFAAASDFAGEYPLPAPASEGDAALQHAALSSKWQGTRMALSGHLRRARRALDKLEPLIAQQARLGALPGDDPQRAASDAIGLLRRYGESGHALAEIIASRLLPSDLQDADEVTLRLWELAPAITAVNDAYVELSRRSFWLQASLSQRAASEWHAEHKLASALTAASEFQWEALRPQLNAVLVHVISFLLGSSEPAALAPLRAQRAEWEKLVTLLRSIDLPRRQSAD